MARTLRGIIYPVLRLGGIIPLALLWLFPLVIGLMAVGTAGFDEASWRSLILHPQFFPALSLSLATGALSLFISTLLAFWIVAGLYGSSLWKSIAALTGGFLSLPHLAFAIGFGFLIMPSGIFARVLGLIGGWSSPPQWVTTQDPFGVALTAALVLKEAPFIIWLIAALLARPDVGEVLGKQFRASQSLGHGSASTWLRVFIPQILPRLRWPLIIVWVYGASVVDMALAIGPTQPPPLAVIIWSDLNNVDQIINARGTAGAVFLTFLLALLAILFHVVTGIFSRFTRGFLVRGPALWRGPHKSASLILVFLATIYFLVLIVLCIMSAGSQWPYPNLWPTQFRLNAWAQLVSSPAPLAASLVLVLSGVAAALVLAVLWFEAMHESLDRYLLVLAVAALAVPSLLIADGQYLAFLRLNLNGTWFGVFLSTLTPVFAYVFIVMKGPYRAFDPRYRSVSLGLNASAWKFWLEVKLPLMKPVIAAAAAVGVGVSIAQYVPVQLIASGRIATLTTDAVTLSSGGNRPLLAVYALLLALIPLIGFLLATRLGRRTA